MIKIIEFWKKKLEIEKFGRKLVKQYCDIKVPVKVVKYIKEDDLDLTDIACGIFRHPDGFCTGEEINCSIEINFNFVKYLDIGRIKHIILHEIAHANMHVRGELCGHGLSWQQEFDSFAEFDFNPIGAEEIANTQLKAIFRYDDIR